MVRGADIATWGVAHVDYVTTNDTTGIRVPLEFLAGVFSDPLNIAVLLAGLFVAGVCLLVFVRYGVLRRDIVVFRRTMESYRPYLPWMLRLSVGLPLIGSGFGGYLFTPELMVSARLPLVALGFLLLFGLLTRVAALIGLGFYIMAIVGFWPEPLLAIEYVSGFLAIAVLGAGQPSADGLLERMRRTEGTMLNRLSERFDVRVFIGRTKSYDEVVGTILRIGIGMSFVYLGLVQKLMQPQSAIAVVEKYGLTNLIGLSPEMWVASAGLAEIAVGTALLFGVFVRAASAGAFGLFVLTLFGLPDDPVIAHVTLFGMTSAILVTGAGKFALPLPFRKRLEKDD